MDRNFPDFSFMTHNIGFARVYEHCAEKEEMLLSAVSAWPDAPTRHLQCQESVTWVGLADSASKDLLPFRLLLAILRSKSTILWPMSLTGIPKTPGASITWIT